MAERRKARNLSREALALASDRSWQSISNYEMGRGRPPLVVLERLAAILECEPGDLFEDDADVPA